jgi:DNA-binding IclR family transcriptional regulator
MWNNVLPDNDVAPRAGDGPNGDLQVIARSAAILRFISSHRGAGPVEVAQNLGLTRTTTHRYIASLTGHGFLRRESKESYALGPLMLQLGVLALRSAPVADVAAGPMSRLARTTQQTVALAVWTGAFPVVIRMEEAAQNPSTVTVRVGGQLAYESSHAKIFLTFMEQMPDRDAVLAALEAEFREQLDQEMPRIRAAGVAVHDNPRRGVRAVSAPIFEHPHTLCASLALVGSERSMPADLDAEMYDSLRRAADEISHLMGVS